MKQVYLIAKHEFLETIRRPAFYISILIFFVSGFFGANINKLMADRAKKVIEIDIVDLSSQPEFDMVWGFQRENIVDDMAHMNTVIRDNLKPQYRDDGELGPDMVPAYFLKKGRNFTSADLEKFRAAGDRKTYLESAASYILDDVKAPDVDTRRLHVVDRSAEFKALNGDTRARVDTLLLERSADVEDDRHMIVLIPEDFRSGREDISSIGLWTAKALDPELGQEMRRIIERYVAETAARARDEWDVIERFRAQETELRFHTLANTAKKEGDREVDVVSYLVKRIPVVLVFIAGMVVFMQSIMLLTNTMEEKSNRIVEVLLSSVTPNQFMLGKLIGPLLVFGFFVILFTLASLGLAVGLGFFGAETNAALDPKATGALANADQIKIQAAISAILEGVLPKLPAALLYTILGYLTYAGLFLAVGAFCTDMRQVQALSAPLNILVLSVVVFAIVASLDPQSTLAIFLTWLPPTSSLVMVGRLGSGLLWWEYAGTILIQLATIYVVFQVAGRLFRHAALRGEGLPSLKHFGKLIAGRAE